MNKKYSFEERIDTEMRTRNITQEDALISLNRIAEDIYNIVQVQPMNGPTGVIFHIRKNYQ